MSKAMRIRDLIDDSESEIRDLQGQLDNIESLPKDITIPQYSDAEKIVKFDKIQDAIFSCVGDILVEQLSTKDEKRAFGYAMKICIGRKAYSVIEKHL